MKTALAAALLLVLGSPVLAQEQALSQETLTYEIRGRVIDIKGEPVANIQVATGWNFQQDSAKPRWRSDVVARTDSSLLTDKQGRFSGTLYARRPTVALFALDMKNKVGAIFIFSKENPGKECKLKLKPLVRLHGKVSVGDSKLKDETYYIYVTDKRARIAIASFISKGPDFSFFMPPGEYEMSFSAKDLVKVTMEVELTNDDLNLRAVELAPTNLARHYGKEPPPWTITDARGVSKDVMLSDYKGKWVLIEFWAYW